MDFFFIFLNYILVVNELILAFIFAIVSEEAPIDIQVSICLALSQMSLPVEECTHIALFVLSIAVCRSDGGSFQSVSTELIVFVFHINLFSKLINFILYKNIYCQLY